MQKHILAQFERYRCDPGATNQIKLNSVIQSCLSDVVCYEQWQKLLRSLCGGQQAGWWFVFALITKPAVRGQVSDTYEPQPLIVGRPLSFNLKHRYRFGCGLQSERGFCIALFVTRFTALTGVSERELRLALFKTIMNKTACLLILNVNNLVTKLGLE